MKKLVSIALFVAIFTASASAQAAAIPVDIKGLLEKHTCYTCHKVDKKMVGPSWQDVAKKNYSAKQFTSLVYKPVPANWPGYTPMVVCRMCRKETLKK